MTFMLNDFDHKMWSHGRVSRVKGQRHRDRIFKDGPHNGFLSSVDPDQGSEFIFCSLPRLYVKPLKPYKPSRPQNS